MFQFGLYRGSIEISAEEVMRRRSTVPDQVPPGGIVTEVPKTPLPTRITSGINVVFRIVTMVL